VPERITPEELDIRFSYHRPDEEKQQRMAELREQFLTLAEEVILRTKPCREQSLAITHLEQAQFFTIAAIARRELDSDLSSRDENPGGVIP
jgi:hypothetical protein